MTRVIEEHRTREPRQVRWVMAREWWYPPGFGRAVKQPLTRWLFARLAQAYDFVLAPPVLSGDLTRGDGVAGVRHALALTRGDEPALVGLAPEGNTGPGGALQEPPSGVGLFLLLLTHEKIPLLPIGWYEDERGVLTINFGAPLQLHVPRLKDRQARDRAAATQAMTAIGRLLPGRLWGVYRGQIVG
jgi:1-acyl-sn-glycerol-3-phosphate acyltransferase